MDADRLLIDRVRAGDAGAWEEFIGRYEGRLLAFADSRLRNRARAEDVVQEAFLGFLVSLPNYDETQSLEAWLFAITAHKLTDALRKEGRRPTVPLFPSSKSDSSSGREPAGRARVASSIARSREGRDAQAALLQRSLRELITDWKAAGEWERLMCCELLFVVGLRNKEVADRLSISEQAVANHKYFAVNKLKTAAEASKLRDADLKAFGVE
ncbi:RNA polymerase sigma factor [Alienimonas californiensis]|uniref:ECF RNA polymerase sigma-E factor n=1 Tax=Alienimonas californiensis TaxID=2527989 RepID=A0A517P7D3_9PLAN|nr:sigma-70 family RNA polymerase sigma factor [Alienimonas californiensis]QDT15255.1 ECF RNA polymerase sigma-E factor [Alienimonas californiensis]